MRKKVTINARRLKTYEAAENACRGFRQAAAMPVCDVTSEWSVAYDLLLKWMRKCGKAAYLPPIIRKRKK